MTRARFATAVCLVFTCLAPAFGAADLMQEFSYEAQIMAWETRTGEVVTPSARKAVLRAIATDFSATATYAGIDVNSTSKVAEAIRDAGDFSVKPQGVIAKWSAGEVRFAWYDSNQFATVASTLKPELVSLQIERMPSITIVVDPVPPVDYLVQINGDPVRVNKEGRYRVDAGDVVVRVTRAARQDCLWKGNLQAGAVQQVACKL